MARPTKRTPKVEEAILTALRAGCTRTAAAEYVGIPRDTLYGWIARFSPFRLAVVRAEAEAEVLYTGILRKAAPNDWRAALAWLERRRFDDWGRRDRVDIVQTVRVMAAQAGLSDAETEAAVAEAERHLREMKHAGAR